MKVKIYVIITGLRYQDIELESLHKTKEEALEHFEELKEKYKKIGVRVEFDDLLVFNNGDTYKIEERRICIY